MKRPFRLPCQLAARGLRGREGRSRFNDAPAYLAACPPGRPCSRDQAGFSLIDVVLAMVILGTAVIALVTGLINAVALSAEHRTDATAVALLRNYAESLNASVLQSCPEGSMTPPTFANNLPALPAGYNLSTSPALGSNPSCPNPTTALTLVASYNGASVGPSLQIALSVP